MKQTVRFPRDYAEKDPRSVAAYLRGKGDYRSALYERFVNEQKKKHEIYTEEQAHQDFALFSRKVNENGERLAGAIIWMGKHIVSATVGIGLAALLYYFAPNTVRIVWNVLFYPFFQI
jgi:hypothetical protein